MKKYAIILFLGLYLASGLWSNPFTGNKKTPAPIRTEQTPEFIIRQQAQLHTTLGNYIYEWTQTYSIRAFWTIISAAFFYGCIHALGPGHRKGLVFSFYLSKPAPMWEPAFTSLILAGLHGISSIALLLIFRNVGGALSVRTAAASIYMEGFSLILLLLLSIASILHMLAHIFPHKFLHFQIGRRKAGQIPLHSRTTTPPIGRTQHIPQKLQTATETPDTAHKLRIDTGFPHGCGTIYDRTRYHAVQPRIRAEQMQWGVFLLSGIYPCPAALLVLVLVSTLDAAGIGVAAIISMSVGMAIPITAVAYLAWSGRMRLFKRISKTQHYLEMAALLLGLTAYSVIFIFSLITVLPFLKGLVMQF